MSVIISGEGVLNPVRVQGIRAEKFQAIKAVRDTIYDREISSYQGD